ncbi:MAG TPA: hypothetical protein P5114_02380 [Hyphomicrobiaceae bacterium]|nr:hypothetical protein [Hyphomicrobiaceae bacterium]
MGRLIGCILAGLTVLATLLGPARAATCTRAEFEAVVDEAAAALRDLNLKNRPTFQEKLRGLKVKRGWSHDQFLKEALPYVKDEQIDIYDQSAGELLNQISRMGQEGAEANKPDCALLEDLHARMKKLVEIQTDKWAYMFGKLAAELEK